jgi:ubiquitin-conjugating enzyme E2 D/E
LEKDPLEFCVIDPNSTMDVWTCHLVGPPNSPYAGGHFVLDIAFPPQYPFKAPTLKFQTKVYHPSVSSDKGEICAAVLGEWGPTLNVRHCLLVVISLLATPSADHPLEESIATQLREKPKEFEKTAKKYTKEYAK